MSRLPRIVVPGYPHHVTQRGNRRERTFFEDGDYALYRELLGEAARNAGAEIWCYCLMPNHVHVVVVPSDADGLRRTFADVHRRYTGFINARHRWTGHLWQGRYGAAVMDEVHLANAVRYVSFNPVRARLARDADDWRWSSVRAHLAEVDDELVTVGPVLERYGDFAAFLGRPGDEAGYRRLRQSETTGRPIGDENWMRQLEAIAGKPLLPQKRGPKKKVELCI